MKGEFRDMDLHNYKDVAENYDFYLSKVGGSYKGFEEYYISLATQYGKDGIIDIACGTGALTIPLAEAGYDVTATDLSESMVEITKRKVAMKKLSVKTFSGNMIDFVVARKFSLAIIARSGFMHLTTYEEQKKALLNIGKHLVNDGILTFNTFDPDYNIQVKQMHTCENDYTFRTEYVNSEGKSERIYDAIGYNPETQLMSGKWKFETLSSDGSVESVRIRELKMRQSYPIQIHYLAEKCGYEVIEAEKHAECNNNIIWILKKKW